MLLSLQMQKLVLLFNFRSRRKTNFIHKLKLQLSPVVLTCFYSSRFLAIGYSLVAIPLTPCRTVKKPGGPLAARRTIYGSHTWSGGPSMATKIATNGPEGPVVARDHLRRDSTHASIGIENSSGGAWV